MPGPLSGQLLVLDNSAGYAANFDLLYFCLNMWLLARINFLFFLKKTRHFALRALPPKVSQWHWSCLQNVIRHQ